MQAGSRKAHGKATLDAMCLAVQVHPQAEDSGGYELDAAPGSEEVDLLISEDVPSGVVGALLCLGGECGHCLCHALPTLWLQLGVWGAVEEWRIIPSSLECSFRIQCLGQEEVLFLGHDDGQVYLKSNSCNLCSLQWYVEKHLDGYRISCYSKGSWMYFRHAFFWEFLQTAYLGSGELWQLLIE